MTTSKRTNSGDRKRVRAALDRPRAVNVRVLDRDLVVELADGRVVRCALDLFPRLATATKATLREWRLIGPGIGIRWEALDEDISVESLVAPRSAPLTARTRRGA